MQAYIFVVSFFEEIFMKEGKQGFKAGNEAKIRSLEWTTIQYDWHLYKKRKFEYRITEER